MTPTQEMIDEAAHLREMAADFRRRAEGHSPDSRFGRAWRRAADRLEADALAMEAARLQSGSPVSEAVTELDASGEAMICEGCGTTRTVAAVLASHGPRALSCCPERKMVSARYFWWRALQAPAVQPEAPADGFDRPVPVSNIISSEELALPSAAQPTEKDT